jgi:tRNA (guanine10-N2)-dimethyltransferase
LNDLIYFFLSGEHPTLPKAEITAILEAERVNFNERGGATQLYRVEASSKALNKVYLRSAMCRSCGIDIFSCKNRMEDIVNSAKEIDFTKYIKRNETFSVRITRVADSSKSLNSTDLERSLGRIIKENLKQVEVNLKNPMKKIQGILTDEEFLLGLNIFEKDRELMQRRPRKRPVFHPSTMEPKLARCMINLSRARKDSFLLDPFCGVGGILIEAGLIGCRILGCDLSTKMIEGTKKNLKHFKLEAQGIILSDARKIAFTPVDNIVTDPPYGKNSSSLGVELENLFRDFIYSAYNMLKENSYISFSSPKGANLVNLGEDRGFKLVEVHDVYIHRSLTREIVVFKR